MKSRSLTCGCGIRMSGRRGGQCLWTGSIQHTAHTRNLRAWENRTVTATGSVQGFLELHGSQSSLRNWDFRSQYSSPFMEPWILLQFTTQNLRVLDIELTPRSRVFLKKLPVAQQLKNISTFYGTRRIITMFIKAHHCSLSSVRLMQSTYPYLTYVSLILTITFHLRQRKVWRLVGK
jgi:hypothetical protein